MADVSSNLVKVTVKAMTGSEETHTLDSKCREWEIQADGSTVSVGFETTVVARKVPDTQCFGIQNPNFMGKTLYLTASSGSARIIEIIGNGG